ncbi:hypothetical protein MNBD_GAMMA12-2740 [hydrothermal vent metagenome]|uniref:Uncharacterized protein n=1 Tax=hydrothermal vent metagenome TaxID=652676 RepID=A0A3B0YCN4_9ZZZZ
MPAAKIDLDKVEACDKNKPADSTETKSTRKRTLTFTVDKEEAYSFLSFKEQWAPEGRKPGRINIPLGFLKSQDKKAESQSDNILVPVLPRRYIGNLKDPDHIEALRENGYAYIFMDGFLWRELKVVTGGMFSEVNLEAYQGNNKRHATGEKDTRILLPYKSLGETPKLHICYSEIQWSWPYILRMGGMNPDDHRLARDKSGKVLTKMPADINASMSDAEELRAKRLQEIDLSNTDTNFQKEAANDEKVFVQNSKDAPETVSEEIHRSSEIAHFIMIDSVGIARDLHVELVRAYEKINTEVLKLQGLYQCGGPVDPISLTGSALKEYQEQHSKYKMAEFIAEYVYMGPDRIRASDGWDEMDDDKKEAVEKRENFQGTKTADSVSKFGLAGLSATISPFLPLAYIAKNPKSLEASPYLDKSVLLDFLQFKKFEGLIADVVAAKSNLVHWMTDEKEKNRFIASMRDYFSSEAEGYRDGLETIRDLVIHLTDHAAGAYAHLLLDYEYFKELSIANEESEDFNLQLFGENQWNGEKYPLYSWLFAQAGSDPENVLEFKESISGEGMPEFNTKLFTQTNNLEDKDQFQIGRRIFHLLNKLFVTTFNQPYIQKSDLDLREKRLSERSKNLDKAKSNVQQRIDDSQSIIDSRNKNLSKVGVERDLAEANYQKSLAIEERNASALKRTNLDAYSLEQQSAAQMRDAKSKKNVETHQKSLKTVKTKWRKVQLTVVSELNRQRVLEETLKGLDRGKESINKIKQGKITGYSRVKANPFEPLARMMAQFHELPSHLKLQMVEMSVDDLRNGNFSKGIPILSTKSRRSLRTKLDEYEDLLKKNLRKVNGRTAKAKVTADMPLKKLTHMDPESLKVLKELCGYYDLDAKSPPSKLMVKVLVLEDTNLTNAEQNKVAVDEYNSTNKAVNNARVKSEAGSYTPSKDFKAKLDQLIPDYEAESNSIDAKRRSQNIDENSLKRIKAARTRLLADIHALDKTLQQTGSIKLPKSQKAMFGMQAFFGIIEVWNFSAACNQYLRNGSTMDKVNAASALMTLTASVGALREVFLELKYGGFSEKHTKQLIRARVFTASQIRWKLRWTVIFRRIGIVSNIFDGILEAKILIEAIGKSDWAGAFGAALMGVGFGLGIAALYVPVLGWFAIAFLLVGAMVKYFSDSALETWMKHCPFGGSKEGSDYDAAWLKTNELSYLELIKILYGEPGCLIRSRTHTGKIRPIKQNYVQYSEIDVVVYTPLLIGSDTMDVALYLAPYGLMDRFNKEYRQVSNKGQKLQVRDLGSMKEFERIDLEQAGGKESGRLGVGLDMIWGEEFVWRENDLSKNLYDGSEKAPGYHLRFRGSCFKQAVDHFGVEGITLMVQIQVSPKGKGNQLFPKSSIDLVYPGFDTGSVVKNKKVNDSVAYSHESTKEGLFYFAIAEISPAVLISDPKVQSDRARTRNDQILEGLCSTEKIKVNGGYIPEYCR